VNRSLNMFTLIGLGVGVAYGYSLIAALLPGAFPHPSAMKLVGGGVLRGSGGDHDSCSSRASSGIEGAKPNRCRHPGSSRNWHQKQRGS